MLVSNSWFGGLERNARALSISLVLMYVVCLFAPGQ